MQILAFDFGTHHIGVAVGQTVTKTSSPLVVLNVAREGKEIWNTISKLIDEWKPDQLLVGNCLLYTSPSPRDLSTSRMPSSA